MAAQKDIAVIEELFSVAKQTDEGHRITQRLQAGDAQAEEVILHDPELVEAKRLSFFSVEEAALQSALDTSMSLSLDAVRQVR